MAAGLGFKDFVTGEVLTAADVDGYLMQGVWVFASAAARDAAVTSPQEGNFAYLKDTNVTTYYTGSAWANLDTTGMTNPMTTTGDTIYSSSGSTPARLGIGTAGQVLQVNSGATAPEWATPASGSMTLLTTNTLSSTSTTISIITTGYKSLQIAIFGVNHASAGNNITLQFNSVTSGYFGASVVDYGTATSGTAAGTAIPILFGNGYGTGGENLTNIEIPFYTKTSIRKPIKIQTSYKTDDVTRTTGVINGVYSSANTAAISSITIISGAAPTAGTVEIYGIN
jgi:hypothetical protein